MVKSKSKSKRLSAQFKFILCVLAILFYNTATARPINSPTTPCTLTASIDRIEEISTIGLQEFGKQLSSIPSASNVAHLTILPGSFDELCQVNAEDYNLSYLKDLRFPKGSIAIIVDLDSGACDVLTKASNALLLQTYLTRDLHYVLFYKSKDRFVNEIPTLDLRKTLAPTDSPTMLPTNSPSQFPTLVPTQSMQPSSRPSLSFSPSLSSEPSNPPSVTVTQAPTTHAPTTHAPTTQAPTTQAPQIINIDPISIDDTISPSTEFVTLPPVATATEAPSTYEPTMEPSLPVPVPVPTNEQPSTTAGSTTTQPSSIDSIRLNKASHLQNKNPFTYEITNIFDTARERQIKELQENDSMVFLTLSMEDAHSILAGIYRSENWEGGKTPIFSKPGNENWDMKLYVWTGDISPTCGDSYPTRRPTPSNSKRPAFVTSKPTQAPVLLYSPGTSENQPYQDNAPGTFAIFKFIFFALLIASPCLRLAHQWWAGGGRIRLRRSEQHANRVVGLQYIPPMDNWFGSPMGDATEVPRPPDRLTYRQIMSLPEIQYTKPIHTDDKLPKLQEEDETDSLDDDHNIEKQLDTAVDRATANANANANTVAQTNTSETESEVSEASFENEPSVRLEQTASPRRDASTSEPPSRPLQMEATPTTEISNPVSPEPEPEPEPDQDDSVVSEVSFENEPSVRLALPTSPLRVSSSTINQTPNPISPRAIVLTEDVPPDEETPQEQSPQHPQEPPNLQQPRLSHSSLTCQSPTRVQEEPSCLGCEPSPDTVATALSFRTQRRLQNFTTTTCTTCSICIDEFEEGETIRLLPRCGHAFHTSCILPWLQDRQGCCPLCKMEVLDRSMDSDRAILGEDVNRRAEF